MMMTMMMISRLWFVSLFFYYSISSMVPRITQQPRFSFVISYVSSLWATFSCIYLILTLSPLGTSIHHYSSSHNIKCSFFSQTSGECNELWRSVLPFRIPYVHECGSRCLECEFKTARSASRLPSGRKYPILYTVSPSEVGGNEVGLALLSITVLICTNSGTSSTSCFVHQKGWWELVGDASPSYVRCCELCVDWEAM